MFFVQFGLLFANMAWFVIVCLIVGVVCLAIEAIQPGFGVFGISGIVLLVLSVILRAVFHQPDDNVLMQCFQFVLLDVVIIGLGVLILVLIQKKGWFKKTSFFLSGTAVDETFSDGTKNFSFLVGKEGVALTILRPSGKAEIEGVTYDVESENFLIEKGEKITVVAAEGGVVKVKKSEIE